MLKLVVNIHYGFHMSTGIIGARDMDSKYFELNLFGPWTCESRDVVFDTYFLVNNHIIN